MPFCLLCYICLVLTGRTWDMEKELCTARLLEWDKGVCLWKAKAQTFAKASERPTGLGHPGTHAQKHCSLPEQTAVSRITRLRFGCFSVISGWPPEVMAASLKSRDMYSIAIRMVGCICEAHTVWLVLWERQLALKNVRMESKMILENLSREF